MHIKMPSKWCQIEDNIIKKVSWKIKKETFKNNRKIDHLGGKKRMSIMSKNVYFNQFIWLLKNKKIIFTRQFELSY